MPKISVIVPVYKVESYLHRCVDSILAQTFTDFELILVDDGSPDNCPAICDEYAAKDCRIHVIHQQNGGLSAARNAGIDWAFANSDSEYLTFVDSDDWVHPRYLEVLYNAVQTCGTAVSMCRCIQTRGEEPEDSEIPQPISMISEDAYVDEPLAMTAWGKLYCKDCFREIRYPVGKLHEDEFVTYRILFAYPKTAVIQAELYRYYTNPNGIINSEWTSRRLDALEGVCIQLSFFHKSHYSKAFKKIGKNYGTTLARHIKLMHEFPEDIITVERKTRRKLRRFLLLNGYHVGLRIPKYAWVYEEAFPNIMSIYWLADVAWNKLKRALGR